MLVVECCRYLTWDMAKTWCEQRKTHIAVLRNKTEHEFFTALRLSHARHSHTMLFSPIYLGLRADWVSVSNDIAIKYLSDKIN